MAAITSCGHDRRVRMPLPNVPLWDLAAEPAFGLASPVTAACGPRPTNTDFPLLKVERPCCDADEGARLKGKQ
jgi:hypothetical protein